MHKSIFSLALIAASSLAINIEAAAKANSQALVEFVPTATSILPSSVMDLTYWKVQLPYSCTTSNGVTTYSFTSGTACEVFQPALAILNNAEVSVQTSVIDGKTQVVQLFCPITAVWVSGATHPRTEFRSMSLKDNTQLAAIGGYDNIYHYLEFSGTVVHLPYLAQLTTIMQLFCGDAACSGAYMELLAFSQSATADSRRGLIARIKNSDGSWTNKTIDALWDVKKNYSFKFVLFNTTLSIYYNGVYATSLTTNPAYVGLYYKAGNYCQSYVGYTLNGQVEDPSEYCLVYQTGLKIYDVKA